MSTHHAFTTPAAIAKVCADRYRLAQAAELQVRFREIEGRAATSRAELSAWVARSDIERPVVPRASLLE